MRQQLLLATVVAALVMISAQPAFAVSDEEFKALREELRALSQRLDQIEQSKRELEAENARLREARQVETPAPVAAGTAPAPVNQPASAPVSSSWTDNIKLKGDFRFRHETIDEQGKDKRRRDRIRARAAIIAQVTDDVEVGFGMASGGTDPVSTNQTLGAGGSSKDLRLDLAYFDWSGLANTRIVGGKFKNILHRTGKNALLWDGDWNPEGAGVAWKNDHLFANVLGTWLESDSSKETEFSYGGQFGWSQSFDGFDLLAGIGYYHINTAGKGSFYGDDNEFFGNSYDPVTLTYLYNYYEVEMFAELGFDLAGKPLSFFFDYVNNQDAPEYDTGYAAGFKYGSAKSKGSWEFGYVYQDLEKDAVYGLLTDSDFGGGGTDARGHILKGGYAIARNWTADFTWFLNERYISGTDPRDFDRLQLDFNFKY